MKVMSLVWSEGLFRAANNRIKTGGWGSVCQNVVMIFLSENIAIGSIILIVDRRKSAPIFALTTVMKVVFTLRMRF